MKNQLGRSLIEVVGVMAIGAVMTGAVIAMYKTIRNNQVRNIAAANLEQIADDVKLLMELRGDYTGVSVDYLVKAGALKKDTAPLGGPDWSVTPTIDGTGFQINLVELTSGECAFFHAAPPKWTTGLIINGVANDGVCMSSNANEVSFVVE